MLTTPLSVFIVYFALFLTYNYIHGRSSKRKACPPFTFGWNCSFYCACQSGSCDPADGSCASGCENGKYGFGCQLGVAYDSCSTKVDLETGPENFCRNPQNQHGQHAVRPWCFTSTYGINSFAFWENIQRCKDECLYDNRGLYYTGSVNITNNGSNCFNWMDPTVQSIGFTSIFPHGDVPENFCRNPQNQHGQHAVRPWCFTSIDGITSFAFCENIQRCNCPNGLFGPACDMFCHCLDPGDVCNKRYGSCQSGCAPGWTGVNCQKECPIGTYGLNCAQSCTNCYRGRCDPTSGECETGCNPGYKGMYCNETCRSNYYGRDCAKKCGNCSGGETCHRITGLCFRGCAEHFTGKMCTRQVCQAGRYGSDCSEFCDCGNDTACHSVTGECYIYADAVNEMGITSVNLLIIIGSTALVGVIFGPLCFIVVKRTRRKAEKEYIEHEKSFLEGTFQMRTASEGNLDDQYQLEEYDPNYDSIA